MITRSTLVHLRIPFSIFLLPVYLFSLSLSIVNKPLFINVLLSFFIVHILLYPASNGFNSYFDKDENSIGGLKSPPKVDKSLYFTSLIFDLAGIVLGLAISWQFAVMLIIYGLISKAYSHPSIRLKKYPLLSWFIVGLFQGWFSFLMSWMGINNTGFEVFSDSSILIPGILSSLMLWGSYPMTQIYQHEEDEKRGDITLSLKLGINGTFHFTMVAFSLAMGAFILFFYTHFSYLVAILFGILLTPVLIYFFSWYLNVLKDADKADFEHTMKLNILSSIMLSLFFLVFAVINYYSLI